MWTLVFHFTFNHKCTQTNIRTDNYFALLIFFCGFIFGKKIHTLHFIYIILWKWDLRLFRLMICLLFSFEMNISFDYYFLFCGVMCRLSMMMMIIFSINIVTLQVVLMLCSIRIVRIKLLHYYSPHCFTFFFSLSQLRNTYSHNHIQYFIILIWCLHEHWTPNRYTHRCRFDIE